MSYHKQLLLTKVRLPVLVELAVEEQEERVAECWIADEREQQEELVHPALPCDLEAPECNHKHERGSEHLAEQLVVVLEGVEAVGNEGKVEDVEELEHVEPAQPLRDDGREGEAEGDGDA